MLKNLKIVKILHDKNILLVSGNIPGHNKSLITILRQFIDETQEVEVTKVEKLLETKPLKDTEEKEEVINIPKPIIKPVQQVQQQTVDNEMPTFFGSPKQPEQKSDLNSSIDDFEKLTQQNTLLNTPKVEFSDKNSVLTFESQNEDDSSPISLGDMVPLNNLEFEDLDSGSMPEQKKSDAINLEFEEL